jgi:hypothetical protein
MSTAEMKLELIRVIDRMTEQEIADLLKQLSEKGQLPDQEKKLRFGALKGVLIHMSPDFNSPMEDFKEYME